MSYSNKWVEKRAAPWNACKAEFYIFQNESHFYRLTTVRWSDKYKKTYQMSKTGCNNPLFGGPLRTARDVYEILMLVTKICHWGLIKE